MEMSDILALVRAGYSRQEIETMSGTDQETKQESEQEAKQEQEQEQEAKQEQEPEAKPESFTGDTLEELMRQMRGVVEAMQMQARNSAQQPPEETTDDIIANIIRPKGGRGGKK